MQMLLIFVILSSTTIEVYYVQEVDYWLVV